MYTFLYTIHIYINSCSISIPLGSSVFHPVFAGATRHPPLFISEIQLSRWVWQWRRDHFTHDGLVGFGGFAIYIYATVTVASYDTIQGLYGIVTFFIRICSNQPVCTTLGDFMEQFAALFQMVTSLSGELTSTSSLYGKWIWIELSSFVFNMFSWLWRSVNVWHIWGLVKARETAMELRRKFNFPCHVVQAFGIVKCRSWVFFFTF